MLFTPRTRMSHRTKSRKVAPLFRGFCLALSLTIGFSTPILADGNPDIVGVLAVLTDTNTAADLGLSDEQLEKLKVLVKQHEAKAIEFASELRAIEDVAQRRERSRAILRGVENEGMGLLNAQQRARAEQLRLQGLGLTAALEPEIATALTISEEQAAKLQTIIEGKRGLMRELGPERGPVEFAKQLDGLLDDTQRAKWAELIGPVAGKVSANPADLQSASGASVSSSFEQSVCDCIDASRGAATDTDAGGQAGGVWFAIEFRDRYTLVRRFEVVGERSRVKSSDGFLPSWYVYLSRPVPCL